MLCIFAAHTNIYIKVMKKVILLVPAALCLAFTIPVQGHSNAGRMAEEPDTVVVVDSAMTDSIDDDYFEDSDWAGGDVPDDSVAVDSLDEGFCSYNDELISEFSTKNADYSLQNPADANAGATFSATLFTPDADKNGEVRKGSGYSIMTSRILTAMLPAEDRLKWKLNSLGKMLEMKWESVKRGYQADQADMQKAAQEEHFEYHPSSYSYRTSITPVWQWKNRGLTTYSIEDEAYTGGAHGILFHYYFTLNERTDSLLSLTDIFKPEALPQVFSLVGEKLKTGPQAANDEETWPSVAEVIPAPTPDDYSVVSHQMEQYQGKWYPRPALTECGIVFTYPPYVKNCYAAGTIHILITYDEAAEWLKK